MELRDSKEGPINHLRTSRFQETESTFVCLEVSKDLIRLLRSWLEERSRSLFLKTELSMDLYPFMVEDESPLVVLR